MGDPRLTRWETEFLVGMRDLAATAGGPLPSAKQQAILDQLAAALSEDPAEPGDSDDADEAAPNFCE
jgi:hypothetical protein